MAAILRRFLNMTKAATAPIPREGALDTEALNQMRMETETNALVIIAGYSTAYRSEVDVLHRSQRFRICLL